MAGHDWKRVSLPEDFLDNVRNLLRFRWLPANPHASELKVWQCGRCGGLIAGHLQMKLRDARRMAKIPFDFDLQTVQSVHSL